MSHLKFNYIGVVIHCTDEENRCLDLIRWGWRRLDLGKQEINRDEQQPRVAEAIFIVSLTLLRACELGPAG